MEINDVFSLMLTKKYYSGRDLKYNTEPGIFMSPFEYNKLLEYLDNYGESQQSVIKLDLLPISKYGIRYTNCDELLQMLEDYKNLVAEDREENKSFLTFRNLDTITKSRIFSEIEGTLNIESVPTTRKLLDDLIIKNKKPSSNNEQIIHNMANAIEFLNTCPEFNEENLFRLYNLLSENCLDEDEKFMPNHIYRHDGVLIDGYEGCPPTKIKECMDSLFKFVNANLSNNALTFFLPHIVHYYILYIHPYFDFNGRTARMVSYWISLLLNKNDLPPIVSEAINQTKNEYYSALRETRNSHNDLTYFLLYIYKVSVKYFLTYKNVEHIDINFKNKSIVLTETEKTYIKKILISSKGRFTYEDFVKWSNTEMSKQGAFKTLNTLEETGFLKSEINKSNKKLFEVNQALIKYAISF